jgi:flagellar biosynthesis protein FlhF
MQLRTFIAKDMKAALAAMRAALGDEAIIVATETMKDGSVLLRAGLEVAQVPIRATEDPFLDDVAPETGASASRLAPYDERYHENLVARLRGPKPNVATPALPFDRKMLVSLLQAHRTPDVIAQALADEAEKSGLSDLTLALASALDRMMHAEPIDPGHRGAILLVGPPGAGKTGVAARLAAQNCLAGCPVRLAATDSETAGQKERLESLAACLNVPVVQTSTPTILADAVREARAADALLVADTGGCDPRGSLSSELLGFLSMGRLDIVGVVSAANDAEEAGEIADALAKLGATRLIVTGLDLTRRKGALLAFALSGVAIAQVTSSPYLADGFDMLTPLAFSRALLADFVQAETVA